MTILCTYNNNEKISTWKKIYQKIIVWIELHTYIYTLTMKFGI